MSVTVIRCVLCTWPLPHASWRLCRSCLSTEVALHAPKRRHHRAIYPFDTLKVDEEVELAVPPHRVRPAATQYGDRHGVRFSVLSHRDPGRCTLIRRA